MGLAMTIGQRAYEDMAVNRAKNATQNAIDAQRRQAERLGIDPSSGRWQAMENNAQLGAAAQIGAAGTQASWDWLRQAQQQNNFDLNYQLQKRGLDLRQQEMDNANYWRAKAWKMKEDDAEAQAEAQEKAQAETQAEAMKKAANGNGTGTDKDIGLRYDKNGMYYDFWNDFSSMPKEGVHELPTNIPGEIISGTYKEFVKNSGLPSRLRPSIFNTTLRRNLFNSTRYF